MGARPQNPDDQIIYALLLSMYDSYGQTPHRRPHRRTPRRLSLPLRLGICAGALALTVLSSARPPAVTIRPDEAVARPADPTPSMTHAAAVAVPLPVRARHSPIAAFARPRRPLWHPREATPLPDIAPASPLPAFAGPAASMPDPVADPIAPGPTHPRDTGEDDPYASDSQDGVRDDHPKQALDAIRTLRLH